MNKLLNIIMIVCLFPSQLYANGMNRYNLSLPSFEELMNLEFNQKYYGISSSEDTHEDFMDKKPDETLVMSEFIIGYTILEMYAPTDSQALADELQGQWTGLTLGLNMGVEFMNFFRLFWGGKYSDLNCKDDCYYMSMSKFDVDVTTAIALYTPLFNLTVGVRAGASWGNFDGPNITNTASGVTYGGYVGLERMNNIFQSGFFRVVVQSGYLLLNPTGSINQTALTYLAKP